ncbi:hypothetical protein CONPUDRAFT_77268 [Coniophora puteana RWD-64-598 SS2]|uniref:Uncharacterized protein n=1 Tax=Coniophora puteana (strain RWD-64-598) TaxID=741705 RepID=A0A5M3M970_CONPW|nr:uncharacterized protein CONPUDRAFT_77268 [Coniophora puteana RWD-64-598 SS2]EIW75627.1 hypothetical protein CONPUDRAFT_77268 [Coniophora puteana RWD-64-598 SS2]
MPGLRAITYTANLLSSPFRPMPPLEDNDNEDDDAAYDEDDEDDEEIDFPPFLDTPHSESITVSPYGWSSTHRGFPSDEHRSQLILWEMNACVGVTKRWMDFALSVMVNLHPTLPFTVPERPIPMRVTMVWAESPRRIPLLYSRTPYCVYFHVAATLYDALDLHLAAVAFYFVKNRLKPYYSTTDCLATKCIDRIVVTGHQHDSTVGVILGTEMLSTAFNATRALCDEHPSGERLTLGDFRVTCDDGVDLPDLDILHDRVQDTLRAAR